MRPTSSQPRRRTSNVPKWWSRSTRSASHGTPTPRKRRRRKTRTKRTRSLEEEEEEVWHCRAGNQRRNEMSSRFANSSSNLGSEIREKTANVADGGVRLVFLPCKEFSKDAPTCISAENGFLLIKKKRGMVTLSFSPLTPPHLIIIINWTQWKLLLKCLSPTFSEKCHRMKASCRVTSVPFIRGRSWMLSCGSQVLLPVTAPHSKRPTVETAVSEGAGWWRTGRSLHRRAVSQYIGGKFFWMGVKERTNHFPHYRCSF